MGRKRKEKPDVEETYYWGKKEENAVIKYMETKSRDKKDKIYHEFLEYPIHKMIESLIRTYKLYNPEMSEQDLQKDTLSFLLTKFDKFDKSRGTKSYSYFGTVCKNYLRNRLMKTDKNKIRNVSYQDISSKIEENPEYSYELEYEFPMETTNFIKIIIDEIKEEIDNNSELNVNEIKVGYAVIDILNNWQNIFYNGEGGSNIYAKNKVLYQLREITYLSSKEIRNALKIYRSLYEILKKEIYIDDE